MYNLPYKYDEYKQGVAKKSWEPGHRFIIGPSRRWKLW